MQSVINFFKSSAFVSFSLFSLLSSQLAAQGMPGTENGEWRYLEGDSGNSRYSPLNQINASNFSDLAQ